MALIQVVKWGERAPFHFSEFAFYIDASVLF